VPYIVAIILLLLLARPVAADLVATVAAEQGGYLAAAYQACKADADAGDAGCQNYLGASSELGHGTGRDVPEAMRLFRLAALQGLAAAQYNLGRHYAAGLGVRNDEAEAARWYGMAAEQGSPAAQNALAILYAAGHGVPRDPKAVLELFRRAAISGYTLAQLNLAVAFEHDRLMPHDPLRAYIWYSIAARSGSDQALREQAAQGRDRLEQKFRFPRWWPHVLLWDRGPRVTRDQTEERRRRGATPADHRATSSRVRAAPDLSSAGLGSSSPTTMSSRAAENCA
jgi:uncharacterized protein